MAAASPFVPNTSPSFLGQGSAHVVIRTVNHPNKATRISLTEEGQKFESVHQRQRHVEALRKTYGQKYLSNVECYLLDHAEETLLRSFTLESPNGHGGVWGMKVENLMRLWLEVPLNYTPVSSSVITVEIKPKTGCRFAARSRLVGIKPLATKMSEQNFLVDHTHDVKFNHSRFAMNQFHKCSQYGISKFCPSDLFSIPDCLHDSDCNCATTCKNVLRELLQAPQNNLRIFANSTPVPLEGTSSERSRNQAGLARLLTDVFRGSESSNHPPHLDVDWFMDVISTVLIAESEVLQSISAMQHRDVIDVEGASLLLHQLASEHGLEHVLRAVDDVLLGKDDSFELPTSPTQEQIHILGWRPDDRIPSDEVRAETAELLSQLDCGVDLLANWLLALAASDLSIMISFSPVVSTLEHLVHIVPQTECTAGVIGGSHASVAYCLGLTDVGPKGSHKIMAKAKKENGFCVAAVEGFRLQGEDALY